MFSEFGVRSGLGNSVKLRTYKVVIERIQPNLFMSPYNYHVINYYVALLLLPTKTSLPNTLTMYVLVNGQ